MGSPGFSQEGYSVTYKYDGKLFPITFNGEKRSIDGPVDRLIIDDSLSFWYRLQNGYDPLRKKKILGEQLKHHAIFYNFNSNKYHSVVAWPTKKNAFLIEDSIKVENWIFLQDEKEILGYKCRPALRVGENNDTTLVWFSDSIPLSTGPFIYIGFPGLVLEIFDQLRGWHILATKIQKGDFKVMMPIDIKIIPRSAYISPKQ